MKTENQSPARQGLAALQSINIMDLKVGHVIHHYGARFRVTDTKVVTPDPHYPHNHPEPIMVAQAEWIDGIVEPGYFGPDKGWVFQGNARVAHWVEAKRDTRQAVAEAMHQCRPFSLVKTKEVMIGAYKVYSQELFTTFLKVQGVEL